MSVLAQPEPEDGVWRVAFEAYGVRLLVSTNSHEAHQRLYEVLPPGASGCPEAGIEHRLTLNADPNGTFGVYVGEMPRLVKVDLEMALMLLDGQIRGHIALHAPERIFVHAGVVADGEGAIVIPGRTFTGKTTLVAELVRAGATYYSDEFAVLDEDGLVHPYPKPLSLRGEDLQQVEHSVASLGGTAGDRPVPVRKIVIGVYKPGIEWRPVQLSTGQGVLAMLSNTVPARSRPQESLHAITKAVEGAIVLQGDRGEAAEIVPQLLERVPA